MAITLAPEMLESRSRALKTRIISKYPIKRWATRSVYCVGDDVKKLAKSTPIMKSLTKKLKPK